MFNKETDNSSVQNAETVIGPSIKVRGDFHGDGNIIIEGSVEGEISTKQFLSAGENSKIIASIKASSAKIAGSITGDLSIEGYLEISKTAIIKGSIKADQISIEKGATIDGQLTMATTPSLKQEDK